MHALPRRFIGRLCALSGLAAAAEQCFDGAARPPRKVAGAHGLRNFSASVVARLPRGRVCARDSCELVDARSGDARWRRRREPRSDWSLGLTRDGALVFAVGERDFGREPTRRGSAKSARGSADYAIKSPPLPRGRDVAVVAARRGGALTLRVDGAEASRRVYFYPFSTSSLARRRPSRRRRADLWTTSSS